MRFFRRKQPAPEPEAATDHPAELRSELVRLTDLFGAKRATQIMTDGVSLAEARRLRGVIDVRDSQVDEMNERLWALDSVD